MNTKLKIFSIASTLVLAASLSLTACRTVSTTTVSSNGQTNTVESVVLDPTAAATIQGVTAAAVPFAVQKDPNSKAYLLVAAETFEAFSNDSAFDPNALQTALSTISVKELRDPTAQSIVNGAVGFYRGALAGVVNAKIDATKYGPFLKSILHAVALGISTGLSPATPAQ